MNDFNRDESAIGPYLYWLAGIKGVANLKPLADFTMKDICDLLEFMWVKRLISMREYSTYGIELEEELAANGNDDPEPPPGSSVPPHAVT